MVKSGIRHNFKPGISNPIPRELPFCSLQFQHFSNTPACNYQVTLNTLISSFRCVWLGLELKSAEWKLSRSRAGAPCFKQIRISSAIASKNIPFLAAKRQSATCIGRLTHSLLIFRLMLRKAKSWFSCSPVLCLPQLTIMHCNCQTSFNPLQPLRPCT